MSLDLYLITNRDIFSLNYLTYPCVQWTCLLLWFFFNYVCATVLVSKGYVSLRKKKKPFLSERRQREQHIKNNKIMFCALKRLEITHLIFLQSVSICDFLMLLFLILYSSLKKNHSLTMFVNNEYVTLNFRLESII